MSSDQATVRLRMLEITKHFGGVHALESVDFQARAGEVHALCGENGAGKSTLMKILAGVIGDYEGQIELEGRPVRFHGPRDAEIAGIRMIHQELNLVPDLSVAANIFLGREPRTRLGWLDERAMHDESSRLFSRLATRIDPRARVGDLRIGDQQMVEIAKALAFDAAILIMDEPTSALSDAEVARLFRVIADLRRAGTTIVYISHKMNEIFSLANQITILRDGRFVATSARTETRPRDVVRSMVGREIAALHFDTQSQPGPVRLDVKNLALPRVEGSSRPSLEGLTFSLHAGEILGVAGLLGAGRTELLETLFGACASRLSGFILLDGTPVEFRTPQQAIDSGVALVTEDRKQLGLFSDMTVGHNIALCRLRALAGPLGLVRARLEEDAVDDAITRLGIKTAGRDAPITSLSGGNQQKCIIARWLLTQPRVLLLDEPTRGIDVGAKAEIYVLMKRLAAEGKSIIMTSSELPELLTVCDRILVLCEGRLTAAFDRAEATEEAIMHAATQFLDRQAG
jgi:ABC-type sugar transport system ATPase subunit